MITFTVGMKGLFGHPAFLFQNVFTQPKSDKSDTFFNLKKKNPFQKKMSMLLTPVTISVNHCVAHANLYF